MLKTFITSIGLFQFSSLALAAVVFAILVGAMADADLFGELFGDNLSNRMTKGGKAKGLSRY